ncbi:hypothetical protein Sme01_35070 [Sphaerisporangium melleum]|uniref:Uncharacterized protein n=1 Tax=Sphaerisporangium melleum TaxID=321316 RepID=A0A917VMP7_9ACTN|nr:hypothetical protein [Sphaerisporangium melleum]GGK96721.1 hypothetical protein GCM10007964_43720 [Sphaerisporangium melleum]GII71031.1 hypothetical protein Sme01_35070 [Sphaerisporangium melleum]
MYLPPEWPPEVRPPGSPDWESSAVAWLLDAVPPDYRGYGVLRRHPLALARMAAYHVNAMVEAARAGYRRAAVDLKDHLPPHAVEAVLATYRQEGPRLVRLAAAVELVEHALRGEPFVPRLDPSAARVATAPPHGGQAGRTGEDPSARGRQRRS